MAPPDPFVPGFVLAAKPIYFIAADCELRNVKPSRIGPVSARLPTAGLLPVDRPSKWHSLSLGARFRILMDGWMERKGHT